MGFTELLWCTVSSPANHTRERLKEQVPADTFLSADGLLSIIKGGLNASSFLRWQAGGHLHCGDVSSLNEMSFTLNHWLLSL